MPDGIECLLDIYKTASIFASLCGMLFLPRVLGFVLLYFCLFEIQLARLLCMCPSVLLISPATSSSRPCSCDSIGQSFCNCCIPSGLPYLVWLPVLFCPLLQ